MIYEYRDRFSDRLITASARHNGIQIRAVGQQAIDTTSPAGRMMLQMLGSFAEFERAMLRERTKVGLESVRRQGRIGGRRPIERDLPRRLRVAVLIRRPDSAPTKPRSDGREDRFHHVHVIRNA